MTIHTYLGSGLLSARPAAGNVGARYFATDTGYEYVDNGSSWTAVSGSSSQAYPYGSSGAHDFYASTGATGPMNITGTGTTSFTACPPYCQLKLSAGSSLVYDMFVNYTPGSTAGMVTRLRLSNLQTSGIMDLGFVVTTDSAANVIGINWTQGSGLAHRTVGSVDATRYTTPWDSPVGDFLWVQVYWNGTSYSVSLSRDGTVFEHIATGLSGSAPTGGGLFLSSGASAAMEAVVDLIAFGTTELGIAN